MLVKLLIFLIAAMCFTGCYFPRTVAPAENTASPITGLSQKDIGSKIKITRPSGDTLSGRLRAYDSESLILEIDWDNKRIPLSEISEIAVYRVNKPLAAAIFLGGGYLAIKGMQGAFPNDLGLR